MSEPLPPLKRQEIPYDHPESVNMFQPSAEKPFVATPDAIDMYQQEVIVRCLALLQHEATQHQGLDYLQVFDGQSIGKPENLWFIEDGAGGAVTALLPSNY
ncbi:MAG: hypothetical protein AAGB04_07595 [Pseudomonadota bacterium]